MLLNTGFYTAGEAADLLHADAETVRRWAFGMMGDPMLGTIRHPPLIRTELPEIDGERALTFVELVELLYVRAFHDLGVPGTTIREAANVAGRLFTSRHPFALRDAYLDPERVLYGSVAGQDGCEALVKLCGDGQHAFPQMLKPYLEQLEFGGDGVASRWWPMGKAAGVLLDPHIAFGAPIIEEVGMRVSTLAESFDAEHPASGERTLERVAWIYEVDSRHVHTALEFSRWLRRPQRSGSDANPSTTLPG